MSYFRERTMKFPRRQILSLAVGAAALPTVSRMARAQAYPSRPITIIVPYAPGGGSDLAARVLSWPLAATLGQNVIVENVSGGSALIGTGRVARAAPDGYTLLVHQTAIAADWTSLICKYAPGANAEVKVGCQRGRLSVPLDRNGEHVSHAAFISWSAHVPRRNVGSASRRLRPPSRPTVGGVVAVAAPKKVAAVAGVPNHAVVAGLAEHLIVARTTGQHVVARTAKGQIVATSRLAVAASQEAQEEQEGTPPASRPGWRQPYFSNT
jgi:hypothetical protein